MKQYLDLLQFILENGHETPDRTNTGVIFCENVPQMEFNLKDGFPLLTTKKMFLNGTIDELLWFISGSTNAFDLPERTQKWWTPWAKENGDLGPIYGKQLRNQEKIYIDKEKNIFSKNVDQLNNVISSIKKDPWSRRHVITLWNPLDLDEQQLPCCHGTVIQFFVKPDINTGEPKYLSCKMYQRSGDIFIGVPVNIASYSLLTLMVAQVCNLEADKYIHVIGHAHIYKNHIQQVKEQLTREPKTLPKIEINKSIKNIEDFKFEDFKLIDYVYHPPIKGDIAV